MRHGVGKLEQLIDQNIDERQVGSVRSFLPSNGADVKT